MGETYKWTDGNGDTHEYRFNNGVCEGFFLAGEIEIHDYKGVKMTETWKNGLKAAGYLLDTK